MYTAPRCKSDLRRTGAESFHRIGRHTRYTAQLAVSQFGISLLGWAGGATTTATVGLINPGTIALSPAVTIRLAEPSDWLTAHALASLDPDQAAPLEIVADPATLDPGTYRASVEVTASDATVTPQTIEVEFMVLAPDDPLPPDAPLGGVFLTSLADQATIEMNTPLTRGLSFSTAMTSGGGDWLSLDPAAGSAEGVITIQAHAISQDLEPGLHTASVGLSLSDGTSRTVPVGLYVPPPTSADRAGGFYFPVLRRATTTCTAADTIVPFVLAPTPNFVVRQGRPLTVRVQAVNCDGQPATGLTLTAQTGSNQLRLQPEAPGLYSGTWVPEDPDPNVTLVITAIPTQGAPVRLDVQGTAYAETNAPPVIRSAVHAASQDSATPLAPGGWITIFGTGFANADAVASGDVLPTDLQGVHVLLDNSALPLYYVGPEQINAILPWEIETPAELVLRVRNGQDSSPFSITVAQASPGIFTLNQQGDGQAAALLAGTAILAGPQNPAVRGGYVELYAAGLGPISNQPADGAPASSSAQAETVVPVSAAVGGIPADVVFSGLAPGALNLYQVNIRIPEDAPVGPAIEIVLTQGNRSSRPVTIAIQ